MRAVSFLAADDRKEPFDLANQFANNEEEPPLALTADDDAFLRSALEFYLLQGADFTDVSPDDRRR